MNLSQPCNPRVIKFCLPYRLEAANQIYSLRLQYKMHNPQGFQFREKKRKNVATEAAECGSKCKATISQFHKMKSFKFKQALHWRSFYLGKCNEGTTLKVLQLQKVIHLKFQAYPTYIPRNTNCIGCRHFQTVVSITDLKYLPHTTEDITWDTACFIRFL